jgi:pyruvate-formate lyase-activating enzyme
MAFSVATAGCNVNCKMCQNWEISQVRPEQVHNTLLPPDQAASLGRQQHCASLAYLLKNLAPTPVATLERAKAIADAEGLHYVYIGNIPGHPAENTYCPKCRRGVVERSGWMVQAVRLHRGKCQFCQQTIPGVWGSS